MCYQEMASWHAAGRGCSSSEKTGDKAFQVKAVPASESMLIWKQKQVEPLSLQEEVTRLMGDTVQIGNDAAALSCWMKNMRE